MTQREQQLISDVHRLQEEVARLKLSSNSAPGPSSPLALELRSSNDDNREIKLANDSLTAKLRMSESELRSSKDENFEIKLVNDNLTSQLRMSEAACGRLKGTISSLEADCESLRSKLEAANRKPVKTVEKERIVYTQSTESIALVSELKAQISLLERELAASGDG